MLPQFFGRAGLAALGAGALLTLSPKLSHAEQFVLFDVTFTMTWEDATTSSPSKSHHYVKSNSGINAMQPSNWTSPVNYRDGKVHIYLEVIEKPEGGQSQGWALCYVSGGYGCPYTPYYTTVGVYERDVDMHSFYNNAQIDFTKAINEVDLIYTINDSGSGHVHYFPELKDKTTPTKVRIAMVQVSEGATYDPSILPGTGGMGGAGGTGGMAGAGGAAGASTGGSPSSSGAGGLGGTAEPGRGGVSGSATTPTVSGSSSGGGPGAGAPSSSGTSSSSPGAGDTSESAGCSLGSAPTSSVAAWLALGLFGLLRKRRATA
jgi:MYXO-CTERM domain-containing protein